MMGSDDYLVTVCDACLRASCWHLIFPCHKAATSGTKDVHASTLRKLAKEHPSYFSREALLRVCGSVREAR